jgi:hypothetical protein
MSRKKPAPQPPLDWLRQSVWAGEELADELELLDMIEPAKPASQLKATRKVKVTATSKAKPKSLKTRNRSHT